MRQDHSGFMKWQVAPCVLLVVFIGMGAAVLSVVLGPRPAETADEGFHDSLTTCGPILLCMGLVLWLGVYIPGPLDRMLHEAVSFLEAQP